LLQGLSARRRQQLIEQAKRVHYRAGEWLFREGDSANCAYMVRPSSARACSIGGQLPKMREAGRESVRRLLETDPEALKTIL
jgi:CRP-like cAMP-binding protein